MPSFPALAPLTLSATSHQAASLDLAVSEPHGLLWPGFNATAPPQHPKRAAAITLKSFQQP